MANAEHNLNHFLMIYKVYSVEQLIIGYLINALCIFYIYINNRTCLVL